MKIIKALFFMLSLNASAFSKTDNRVELTCAVLSDSSVQLTSPNDKKLIFLINDRNTCETSYSFEKNKNNSYGGVVIAGATEMNFNSTESVYQVSLKGVAKNIGNIPTGANFVAYRTYENYTQAAGDFYLTVYSIKKDKVLITSQLQLAVDNVLCFDEKNSIYSRDNYPDKPCQKSASATKEKPICIMHSAEKQQRVALSVCKKLLNAD